MAFFCGRDPVKKINPRVPGTSCFPWLEINREIASTCYNGILGMRGPWRSSFGRLKYMMWWGLVAFTWSHLRKHKFKHSSQDSINPLCSCSLDVESTIHYFLHCPLFTMERDTRLNNQSIDSKLLDSNESSLIQHLLGDSSRDTKANTEILNATDNYVLATTRFDERLFKNVMFW